jgi:hypothetical protein
MHVLAKPHVKRPSQSTLRLPLVMKKVNAAAHQNPSAFPKITYSMKRQPMRCSAGHNRRFIHENPNFLRLRRASIGQI